MRTETDHLPEEKQDELKRAVKILKCEFAKTLEGGTSAHRRNGRILKIILFGSYARTDWVDEGPEGYQSDYDLLVIVSHKPLTDIATYWYTAEDRLLDDEEIETVVNIAVYSMKEVNDALREGEFFFSEIIEDGIMLYEIKGTKPSGHTLYQFAKPRTLTPQRAFEIADKYCRYWTKKARSGLKLFRFSYKEKEWNDAAFMLHQTVERAYNAFLLTRTLYTPKSHNIKFLRSLTEDIDRGMVEAWPRSERRQRAAFEILKRAYNDARYSMKFTITTEQLEWLGARAERLIELVEAACEKRLAELKAKAGTE